MYKVTIEFNTAEDAMDFFAQQMGMTKAFIEAPATNETAPAVVSTIDKVMGMLKDSRYTLRKVNTVVQESGLRSHDELFDLLNKHGIDYVTRRKNGTHEPLVGLTYRN